MSAAPGQSADAIEWPSSVRRRLSPVANKYLQSHPAEAVQLFAEALEAAATDSEPSNTLPPLPRLPEALQRFIVRRDPSEVGSGLLNLSEASEQLHITRATLNAWIKANRVIAWPVTRRGMVVPAEQILGERTVVPGIDRVLDEIGDSVLAWEFLIEESPFMEPSQRPIDALKAGNIDAVVRAARARGEAFT